MSAEQISKEHFVLIWLLTKILSGESDRRQSAEKILQAFIVDSIKVGKFDRETITNAGTLLRDLVHAAVNGIEGSEADAKAAKKAVLH